MHAVELLKADHDIVDKLFQFEPKLNVLMEDIEHHVMEEEGQMFPMVNEQFEKVCSTNSAPKWKPKRRNSLKRTMRQRQK